MTPANQNRDYTDSNQLLITIDAYEREKKVAPTLAELGVIATALNRAINDAATPRIEDNNNGRYRISRQSAEPILVKTSIDDVRNGSVVLEAVIAVTNYVSVNETSIVTGIIASALWDGSKAFHKHLKRAATRLGGKFSQTNLPPLIKEDPFLELELPVLLPDQPEVSPSQSATAPASSTSNPSDEVIGSRTLDVTIEVRGAELRVRIDYEQDRNFYPGHTGD